MTSKYTKAALTVATAAVAVAAPPRASSGYHVAHRGYRFHVRPDALEIEGPDGNVVSYEPWILYESTE
ncbi:hypothetical protein [Gordonia phthalatica]|uniref:Uncharacterized protein n=1 Tax=Gordonia phthalatica TaxID=1136941 RepID=A0A0N9NE44_9ACTN|nr:hypothetical protein [Gordonia phthalatica]ALG85987.1 hypothetical protein ACH46_17675 [Gordonia phthalatica]